jgi:hypothetical protein
MKTIVLGDTHGRPFWKRIIDQEKEFDRLIFVGDYFDSNEYKASEQVRNFEEIIQFKKSCSAEVILLIGNHDFHYFPEIGDHGISGYQEYAAEIIELMLDLNRDKLQMAYQFDDFLFTHAGVSKSFLDLSFGEGNWKIEEIVSSLNDLFSTNPMAFKFNGREPSGDDVYQTPIWIRPESLIMVNKGSLDLSFIQVFGHTRVPKISSIGKITNGRYQLIDCLGTSGEYMIIENGSIQYRRFISL